METIWDIGIAIILYLQNLSEWLIGPMQFFTALGYEEFYLFVAPAIFWCFDMRLGLSLGLRLMTSAAVNSVLKLAFHQPRPYWIDERVVAHGAETSFGLPSGHAQNAVVFWGTIAAWIGTRWAWITGISIAFFIGISRLFLGVHFPTDVLAGWAIGALLLWAFNRWEASILSWFQKYSRGGQVAIAFGASIAMILAGAAIRWLHRDWMLLPEWVGLAAKTGPEVGSIDPLVLSGIVSNAAVFFGLAAGGILLTSRGGFNAGGPIIQRVARFILGIAGVFVIWYGLGIVFPGGENQFAYALRFIRYALIGFWVSGFAPILFILLRLADAEEF